MISIFKRVKQAGLALVALSSALTIATPALAVPNTCVGVEGRVNSGTSALESAVRQHIRNRENQLVAQERDERARLLEALTVLTRQSSLSGQQGAMAATDALEAMATGMAEQIMREQLLETRLEYGSTGFDACGAVDRGFELAQSYENFTRLHNQMAQILQTTSRAHDMGEFESRMNAWLNLSRDSDDLTAATLMSGDDPEAAMRFIALMIGPPRPPAFSGYNLRRPIDFEELEPLAPQLIPANFVTIADGDADGVGAANLGASLRAGQGADVLGPAPDAPPGAYGGADLTRGLSLDEIYARAQELQDEARRNTAIYVLAQTAAAAELRRKLEDMTGKWTEAGSAEAWAQSMAVQGTRATLMDTARIEAANVAAQALAALSDVTDELALATFALTYLDRMDDMEEKAGALAGLSEAIPGGIQ